MKKHNKNKRNKPAAKKRAPKAQQATRTERGSKNPDVIDSLMQKGTTALNSGELPEAETLFRNILEIDPENAPAHNMIGVIALTVNNNDAAVEFFRAAINLDNNTPDYAFNLSLALLQSGDFEASEAAARSALALRPNYAEAWNVIGITFKARLRWQDAREVLEKSLGVNPDFGEAWINICGTFQELGLKNEALHAGEQSVRLAQNMAEAHYNYAGALSDLERYDEAIDAYKKTITLRPDYAEAYINLSRVYTDIWQFDEAEDHARKAIELSPDNYSGHSNLGLALCRRGELREGVKSYQRAIELEPDAHEPHTNLGFALLALEEFSTAWEEFEYGFISGERIPFVNSPTPIWEGQPLDGKTIHIYGEQAIGDHTMYALMIKDVLTQGAKVIYEVERRLVPLLKRSFPEMTILELKIPPDMSDRVQGEDYYISAGSLGRYLRRSVDDFKPQEKFLEPDPVLTKQYRDSYTQLGDGPVIGIAWKSKSPSYGKHKNITLDLWEPILRTPGCTFVSLQYGDVAEDVAWVKNELGVDIHIDENVSALDSLEQCAAQTAAVDLVISISNATVHFSAGCGVETWMLAGRPTMWHWFSEREDSLWYKSLRILRLKKGEEWSVIVDRAASNLKDYLAKHT